MQRNQILRAKETGSGQLNMGTLLLVRLQRKSYNNCDKVELAMFNEVMSHGIGLN